MTALAVAIQREQWTLVALYLLLGVSEAAAMLRPESLDALLDLLATQRPDVEEAGDDR